MQTAQKAEHYLSFLDSKQRDNGEWFVFMRDNRPQALHDAMYEAHGDKLPSDWIFTTFADLLQKISEYNHETLDDLENDRSEIVDSCTDIYTHDLTGWLHNDNSNLSYLEDAMSERTFVKEDGAWQVLAYAQYIAIDEIMQHVINLLASDIE